MKAIILFELRFRLRQISTWMFVMILAVLSFCVVATDFVQVGGGDGPIKATSPGMAAMILTIIAALGSIISAALVGTAIQRDFETGTHDILFATGMRKQDYYFGRYIGSLLVSFLVFMALPLGMMIGSVMPWVDPNVLAPFDIRTYLNLYTGLLVPNLILTGALFFVFGAASRSVMAIYIMGVCLFVGYAASQTLIQSMDNRYIGALLDPFGLAAMRYDARYWTVFEKNTRQITLAGSLLINRAIWMAGAAVLLAGGFRTFQFKSSRAGQASKSSKGKAKRAANTPIIETSLPVYQTTPLTFIAAMTSIARATYSDIVKGVTYKIIMVAGLMLLTINVWNANKTFDNAVLPVTRIMVETGFNSFMLFYVILITFYAGELVWRERGVRCDQIMDALPTRSSAVAVGKFVALALMLVTTTLVVIAGCLLLQIIKGSPDTNLALYFTYGFGISLPQLFILAAEAIFIHTIINQKFMAHGIFLIGFVLQGAIAGIGFDHGLYQIGSIPQVPLSDMNGFGPFLLPVRWFTLYWGSFSALLLLVSSGIWVRGKDTTLKQRFLRIDLPLAPRIGAGLALLAFIGSGVVIFYNTNVLHRYQSSKDAVRNQANYEKWFRADWHKKPQPKVVDVDIDVTLMPKEGKYISKGKLVLENTHDVAINEVMVSHADGLNEVVLTPDSPWTETRYERNLGVHVFRLAKPLAAGGKLTLNFTLGDTRGGFSNGQQNTQVVENGSFLTMPVPMIGYHSDAEISDDAERRRQKLAPKEQMPLPTAAGARDRSYLAAESDWVKFACTVRTDADQIGVAPGYLEKEWDENGRRCFRYVMDTPIRYFFTVVSARYTKLEDTWTAPDGRKVALQVLYHAPHKWNIERMMAGMKASLAYCEANYTPYQYRQLRILEFPAYATFAQAFPNTVPYSEGIGFILNVDKDRRGMDTPFYVTAHETAHQWWAHQVIGADAAGSEMLSEALADYTAGRILSKKLPVAGERRYLMQSVERYLRGRSSDRIGENPLALCQHQQYIHYSKGTLIFTALSRRVGEEKLNSVIAEFARKNALQKPPYCTGSDLVNLLKQRLPEQREWIEDAFEKITLTDFKITDAAVKQGSDGLWETTVKLESRANYSDAKGQETEKPFAGDVKIALTSASDKTEYIGDVIAMSTHKLSTGKQTLILRSKTKPAAVVIDPLIEWLGRSMDDRIKTL